MAIQKAVAAFTSMKQGANENDADFYNRFHEAHARCGEHMPAAQLASVYDEGSIADCARCYVKRVKRTRG